MSDLLWPGLHRAADIFDDAAVLRAIALVESEWARSLEEAGLAPVGTSSLLRTLGAGHDPDTVAVAAEAGGNPLIPFLEATRARAHETDPALAAAFHRGLTSQDVVDTALVLCARQCLVAVVDALDRQIEALVVLATTHRDTPTVARTLGQQALPTTFGLRVAGWLRGLLAARTEAHDVAVSLPVQLGGAVGTLAAVVELCRESGAPDPVAAARELAVVTAERLGLSPRAPWHTDRQPVTRIGDALVTVSDALGHVANDVVAGARSEVGELSEPAGEGRGVSSAMPQKRNPVLSVLVRRHAMSAPLLAAQLHLSAAGAVDERPDGAWHTEWSPLRDLCLRTLAAAHQVTEVVTGLEVHGATMRRHLDAALPGVLAERLVPALTPVVPGGRVAVAALLAGASDAEAFVTAVRSVAGQAISDADLRALLDPTSYTGIAGALVDETVAAARAPRPTIPAARA